MGITRLGHKFDQNARALLSTNQIGRITLEGSIKARGHKKKAALTSRVSVFEERRVFLSIFWELEFVDPDLRFLFC